MTGLFRVTTMYNRASDYRGNKNAETKYEKLEKKQIEAYQEISKAFENEDADKLNEINSNEYKLFKITPDGYMDLDKSKKFDIYKNSIIELAAGEIEKYDSGKDGTINKDEYLYMNQSVQAAIEDGRMSDEKLSAALNTDIFKELSNINFGVMDVDGNGVLDKEEIAARFAFTDASKNVFDENMNKIEGEGMDGRINIFADIIGEYTPESIKESKEVYGQYYNFFFGKSA